MLNVDEALAACIRFHQLVRIIAARLLELIDINRDGKQLVNDLGFQFGGLKQISPHAFPRPTGPHLWHALPPGSTDGDSPVVAA